MTDKKENAENHKQEDSGIQVERLDKPKGVALIKLDGYLQQKEAKQIIGKVDSLTVEGVNKVIFDMSNVKYMNSSAMGAFTNCATLLKAKDGTLVLMNMLSNIRLVFVTLGLLGLFETAKTREEAIKLIS